MREIVFFRLISFKNNLLYLIKHRAAKTWGAGIFSLFTVGGLYFGLWEGLQFITSLGGLGVVIIKKVLFILFFILFFMIAISFGVLFYGMGFKNKETAYLISLPIEREKILSYKFGEAFLFSTWIPSLGLILFFLSYAFVARVSLIFPLVASFYIIPFFIIASFLGYLTTLFLAKFINKGKILLWLGLFCGLVAFLYFLYFGNPHRGGLLFFLSEEVVFFKVAKLWYLPYSWPAYGLIHWEDKAWGKSLLYFLNLWSLAFLVLSFVPSLQRRFIDSYFLQFSYLHKKRSYLSFVEKVFSKISFLPNYLRSFMVKDVKFFTREPAFWLQLIVFFGILFFYFTNLRKFSYHRLEDVWKSLLTFLNTFSILCVVSAMSVRFVFPQWSLEGRNYWILKLSPIPLGKVFLEKIILSLGVFLPISIFLISLSNLMLKIEFLFFFLTLVIVIISTFTMVTISLGLGAIFANFKQRYYLQAVESFGGFVVLMLNLGYVFFTVFLFGGLSHFYFLNKLSNFLPLLKRSLILWMIASLVFSLAATLLGMKKIAEKEY
ncbi:MAG: hypothetical protein DRP68_05830 [Candidatus Omnitrophota bacterium]|nr:MAG: hypothetical protein DRP68_05830 [Candidatus Omnitrophota bacterium]